VDYPRVPRPEDLDFPTRTVREGGVDLYVPDVEVRRGPGTRSSLPFYNPAMAVARDVSVLLAHALLPRGGRVLDGLAATGALGLRVAAERDPGVYVHLVDKNPRAVALCEMNVERNGLQNADVKRTDLNVHLAVGDYALLELDPFGSPVPFLDAALLGARTGAAMGVTATDTAVLCGTKPEAAARRYLARVRHTDAYAEIGVRVLLGYIARTAGKFDRAISPILAFAAEHFVKVYVRVAEGAGRADAALSRLGWVRYDPATGAHTASGDAGTDGIGPLWLGPLMDAEVLSKLHPGSTTGFAAARLLERIRDEVDLSPFYAENNAMARRAGVDPPPLEAILEALRETGHRATRTHFRENAFKTDAPWEAVREAYRAQGMR